MKRYHAFPYDPSTGRILKRDTCIEEEFYWYGRNTVFKDARLSLDFDDASHWIKNGELTIRPDMPISADKTNITADGVDTATIAGVPDGAILRIAGLPDEHINDGTVEFTTDVVGEHRLQLVAFPYRDTEIVVIAG